MAKPRGRPTDYSEELIAIICARIVQGESLNRICKEEGMPSIQSIYLWLFKHKEFSEKYIKAKEDQAETLADEIIEISDNGTNDWMANNDPDNPGYKQNGEAVNRSRLRVDARKWVASKLKPKRYGEKISQEISGPDGGAIPHTVNINFVKPAEEK